MWQHFVNLLYRSWVNVVSAMGTTTLALVIAFIGFILVLGITLLPKLRKDGWSWDTTVTNFIQNLRDSVVPSVIVTVSLWGVLFGSFMVKTIYYDHQDTTGRWQAVVIEKNNLKEILKERDEYIRRLAGGTCPPCTIKPRSLAPSPSVPREPTIKAFSRGMGTDKDGFFVTEYTVTCDTVIPPSFTLVFDFDADIFDINAAQTPTPTTATLGGGERWHGTHGFIPFTNYGLSPNVAWVITVKSKKQIHLLKPPYIQAGY